MIIQNMPRKLCTFRVFPTSCDKSFMVFFFHFQRVLDPQSGQPGVLGAAAPRPATPGPAVAPAAALGLPNSAPWNRLQTRQTAAAPNAHVRTI